MDTFEHFDNILSFLPSSFQKIIQKLSVIDSFKGSWGVIENKETSYLKELKKIATIESIGSSTRANASNF
jgi:hypothetical protein